jgi:hypothetical protein
MTTLKKLCNEVIAAGEKATKRPWKFDNTTFYSGRHDDEIYYPNKETGHREIMVRVPRAQTQKEDPKGADLCNFVVTAANHAENLARALLVMEEALKYVASAKDQRPGYLATTLVENADQALARVAAIFEKGE